MRTNGLMSFKVKEILKSCFLFWKSFILDKNKKSFLKQNQSIVKTQVIVLLASAFVCYVFYSSMRPAVRGACRIVLQSNNSDFDGGLERIAGIEAKRAVIGTTLREVKSIGTLKANAEVVIKSEISGKIAEIAFVEGSKVHKGDILIKFEDDLYKSEKAKYEAEYLLKKSEFERVDNLYKKNVGSKKAFDEASAQMQAAKAQLETAEAQLARTVIKAPFDGIIGIMRGSATPGNIVQQQTELVYIVDNSMVRVEFTVPAKYIDDIAVGQNVEITVDAYQNKVFSGSVDAIDSEVDTRNHSILVRAIIPNKGGKLKHGMFANVKLVTGEKNDVVLIDEDALMREGAIEYVWVVDDKGRAYRQRVLSGAKDINGVEILAGLKDGTVVVTTGQLKLTEGVKTRILNKEEFEESGKHQAKPEEEMSTEAAEQEESKTSDNNKLSIWRKIKNIFVNENKTTDAERDTESKDSDDAPTEGEEQSAESEGEQ